MKQINIGAELSQARERRGLSLTELADRTKISVLNLRAMERGDLNALPGGIVRRGFLRAYAREVGCDPEALVRRYLELFEVEGTAVDAPDGRAMEHVKPAGDAGPLHSAEIDAGDRKRSRAAWISGTAVLICGIGFLLFLRSADARRPFAPEAVEAVPLPQAPALTSVRSEIDTSGTAALGGTPTDKDSRDSKDSVAPSTELQLDVETPGLCWLSAIADEQQIVYRLLNPSERVRIEAREDVVLRIGDAANFRFSINGAAGRQLGAAGQAVTAHITRQNYREFLNP